MNKKATIALTRLILWSDPARIQLWPSILSKVPKEYELKSLTDFGQQFITDRMTDPKHSAAEMITRNLPGIEMQGEKLTIKGIGLLERCGKKYKLSDHGFRLSEAYKADPHGMEWVALLAKDLLTREPRTRMLIKLLSQPCAYLQFNTSKWFGGNTQKAEVESETMYSVAPFLTKEDPAMSNIRRPISENSWWALGKWREHEFLSGFSNCQFQGKINEAISLNGIGSALRASCEVFAYLGILQFADGICRLDQTKAVKLFGAELSEDFGWASDSDKEIDLSVMIKNIIAKIQSDTGYVVASELRSQLKRNHIENPDKEIAQLEENGRLIIEASAYGQSRHGEGLYADPKKQLVKIRIP